MMETQLPSRGRLRQGGLRAIQRDLPEDLPRHAVVRLNAASPSRIGGNVSSNGRKTMAGKVQAAIGRLRSAAFFYDANESFNLTSPPTRSTLKLFAKKTET